MIIHHLTLDVSDCPACGGEHRLVEFWRVLGAARNFEAVCPASGNRFLMNTRSQAGAWEGLLGAAGVPDAD